MTGNPGHTFHSRTFPPTRGLQTHLQTQNHELSLRFIENTVCKFTQPGVLVGCCCSFSLFRLILCVMPVLYYTWAYLFNSVCGFSVEHYKKSNGYDGSRLLT